MAGFYMTSSVILKFSDSPEDIDKIRFNHYIARKENMQRLKCNLPRGQFYFAEMSAVTDLNISRRRIRSILALFEELQIITRIYKPQKGSREPSIFRYNAVINFWEDDKKRINRAESSDFNGFSDFTENENSPETSDFNGGHENEHENEHEVGQSKKETKKELLKTNCAFFEKVWKEYPSKKGKSQISKTTQHKLSKVGEAELLKAISNYKSELEANQWKQPMNGSTFFNGRYQDYLPENFESTLPEQRRRTRILNEE